MFTDICKLVSNLILIAKNCPKLKASEIFGVRNIKASEILRGLYFPHNYFKDPSLNLRM